jgi:hypothetical protein
MASGQNYFLHSLSSLAHSLLFYLMIEMIYIVLKILKQIFLFEMLVVYSILHNAIKYILLDIFKEI